MAYWLMKTEPDVYSIDDLKRERKTHWEGIRNYQARNFMRDDMEIGDRVLIYHSNASPPGIVGTGVVSSSPYPDFTAWDLKSKYYDSKTDPQNPRWMMVDISYESTFESMLSLHELKLDPQLEDMLVIKRGMRLSIQPVVKAHFDHILNRANAL